MIIKYPVLNNGDICYTLTQALECAMKQPLLKWCTYLFRSPASSILHRSMIRLYVERDHTGKLVDYQVRTDRVQEGWEV